MTITTNLKLADELGVISEYEYELGRPLISCLVVRQEDGIPGPGFFRLAKALGRMKTSPSVPLERLKFQVAELRETHDYWAKKGLKAKVKKGV